MAFRISNASSYCPKLQLPIQPQRKLSTCCLRNSIRCSSFSSLWTSIPSISSSSTRMNYIYCLVNHKVNMLCHGDAWCSGNWIKDWDYTFFYEMDPTIVEAIDDDCNQMGQMVVGLLSWPQGTFALKVVLDKEKNTATVEREVDSGLKTLCLDLPAVIKTDLRLNEPRYATLPNIMKTKSKPIKKVTPEELGVELRSDFEMVQVTEPPRRKARVILSSVDELIDKLRNEALVV